MPARLIGLFAPKNIAIAAIISALVMALLWKNEKARYNAIMSEIAVYKAKNEQLNKEIDEKMAEIKKNAAQVIIQERVVTKTIVQRIQDEIKDDRICFADANAWSLYNASITGTDHDRPATAAEASQDETVATVKQVLTNAAENYGICRENAIRHNALIDVVEKLNGNVCACAK